MELAHEIKNQDESKSSAQVKALLAEGAILREKLGMSEQANVEMQEKVRRLEAAVACLIGVRV